MKHIKLFDKKLFFEAFRQVRTICVTYFVLLILQAVLLPLYMYDGGNSTYHQEVLLVSINYLQVLLVIIIPVIAEKLFSFVDSRKASDFYHSLPIKRETMYITYICFLLSAFVVMYSLPTLIQSILLLLLPQCSISLDYFMIATADIFVLGLLLAAVVIISKNIAGNRFGQGAVAIMILFLPRLYILMIKELIMYIAPVIRFGNDSLIWDNSWNLVWLSGLNKWKSVFYTFILAVIYLIIGGFIFVRRKSEKAESVAVSRKAQLLLRIIPALTFSFLPMYVIVSMLISKEDVNGYLVGIFISYVITIVIYFLYELITTRKLKNVIVAAPGLIALFAIHIAVFVGIEGYAHIEGGRSLAPSEIKSVRLTADSDIYSSFFSNSAMMFFKDDILECDYTSDDVKEYVSDMLKDSIKADRYSFYQYETTVVRIDVGDRVLYRNLVVSDKYEQGFYEALVCSKEFGSPAEHIPDINDDDVSISKMYITSDEVFVDLDYADRNRICKELFKEFSELEPKEQFEILYPLNRDYISIDMDIIKHNRDKYGEITETRYYNRLNMFVSKKLMPETYKLLVNYIRLHNTWED